MARLSDRFALEREIGSGGMARVFLGRDEVLDRPVAVKILKSDLNDSEVGVRFRREGRTAARLSHPNIVQVYDAGEDEFEGRLSSYIVMEHLPGGDLKGLLDERGSLPIGELASLGAGVASGLAHAHERGVVHRDVKPHNILLDEHGRPKLADFGIARALDATTSNRTRTGSYLGTAVYSSPEQLQGERVKPASDIYSLGSTLYQAATGQPPFAGSPIEVANQHVIQSPAPPRELNAAIGEGLEGIILSCLAKSPNERPAAVEVRDRLEELEGDTGDPTPYPEVAPLGGAREGRSGPQAETVGASGVATRYAMFRRRRLAWPLLAVLIVAALIAAFAAPRLLKTPDNPGRGNVASQNVPSGGDARDQGRGGDQGGGDQGGGDQAQQQEAAVPQTTVQRTEPQTTPEQTQEQTREQTQERTQPDGLTQEAAGRTVEEFYEAATAGNYGRSSELLSADYRQSKFPSESVFEGTFGTLQSVRFVEGPDVRLSGDRATVTGATVARHTDGTDRNAGSWTLVDEGGRWRISGISVGPA